MKILLKIKHILVKMQHFQLIVWSVILQFCDLKKSRIAIRTFCPFSFTVSMVGKNNYM